jgi:3-methyladenine DNA glycosylase AlkD
MAGKSAAQVQKRLRQKTNGEKAAFFPRFFKAGPGEYAEGDKFLGVIVPDQRKIAKEFKDLPLSEIDKLLHNPYHECRLTAIFILVAQFQKALKADDDATQKELYEFYVKRLDQVNNWDLVDSSAHKIVGPYLKERSRKPLYQFAKARHLWKNRVAMIATFFYIKGGDFEDALGIAEILVPHKHDLIHKAVGWMLREIGKQNEPLMIGFLENHHEEMARVAIRYAIEKLPERKRKEILAW